ncbi:unnamed protein product [Lactuca virosa]|uniref:Uncharacterized protein n=1 Tax=Lactuca virosa TaxID=75947 RepID=A0AAU9LM72_9ASTR|nr:unnamed protein product [Lactuca virosa]
MLHLLLLLFLNKLEIPLLFMVVKQVKITVTVGVRMVAVEEVLMVFDRSKLLRGGVMFGSLSIPLLLDFTLLKAFCRVHLLSISSLTTTSPLILSSRIDNKNDQINNLHPSKHLLPFQTPHILCGHGSNILPLL